MPEQTALPLPFRIEFDAQRGEIVVWRRFGEPPRQVERRKVLSSLEELAISAAEHTHESWLHHALAQALIGAAAEHLGADPNRLRTAVRALRDPACTVPVGVLIHGAAMGETAAEG